MSRNLENKNGHIGRIGAIEIRDPARGSPLPVGCSSALSLALARSRSLSSNALLLYAAVVRS